MPNPAVAAAGAGIASAGAQVVGAKMAAKSQTRAANKSIREQRRQFNAVKRLLEPFTEGGTDAFRKAMRLTGLQGDQRQQWVINDIKDGPEFQSLSRAGENAILANASATGGLRGGNTQAGLADFRSGLLNSLIDKRYGQYTQLAAMGQNSAAMTGTAAQRMADSVSNQYGQIGAAQAGAAIASGQAIANGLGSISQAYGMYSATAPDGAGFFDKWSF